MSEHTLKDHIYSKQRQTVKAVGHMTVKRQKVTSSVIERWSRRTWQCDCRRSVTFPAFLKRYLAGRVGGQSWDLLPVWKMAVMLEPSRDKESELNSYHYKPIILFSSSLQNLCKLLKWSGKSISRRIYIETCQRK